MQADPNDPNSPRRLPAVYSESGYFLGERDDIPALAPAYEVMFEKQTASIPDSLVVLVAHLFNETHSGTRLLLEEAPVGQKFPIYTGRWEICDQIWYTIEDNIRSNQALFPELAEFSFSTVRTNAQMPQGRIDFNHQTQFKLGFRYQQAPKVDVVSLRVDPRLKTFPSVVKDAFVADVGGMVSRYFSKTSEEGADIAREAMLLGRSLILKDYTQIAQKRIEQVHDKMRQTTSYGNFCEFTRS